MLIALPVFEFIAFAIDLTCPRAYAMPPQISTELFSKSLITPARIFVIAEICSTLKPAASRACCKDDFSAIALPVLLGRIRVRQFRNFRKFFSQTFWGSARQVSSNPKVHPAIHPPPKIGELLVTAK